jgi:hypothetical protein
MLSLKSNWPMGLGANGAEFKSCYICDLRRHPFSEPTYKEVQATYYGKRQRLVQTPGSNEAPPAPGEEPWQLGPGEGVPARAPNSLNSSRQDRCTPLPLVAKLENCRRGKGILGRKRN